jgi:protein SEY1
VFAIFVIYLVGKALWVQSEIGREFQHGFEYFELPFLLHSLATKILSNQLLYYCAITQLPTILSLSTKCVPSIMNILKRLADPGQEPATAPKRQREMKLQPKSTRNSSSYSKVTSLGSFSITTLEIGPEYSNLVAQ